MNGLHVHAFYNVGDLRGNKRPYVSGMVLNSQLDSNDEFVLLILSDGGLFKEKAEHCVPFQPEQPKED